MPLESVVHGKSDAECALICASQLEQALKNHWGADGTGLGQQAPGVDTGSKLAFELRGNEVVVTRAEAEHEDPAIASFLTLLEADIRAGKHLQPLPEDLARAMLAHAGQAADLDEDVGGDVAL